MNHDRGVSLAYYEPVRWGKMWISRACGGWTAVAFLNPEWTGACWDIQTRKEFDCSMIGCPMWYVEHQP